jgi:Zn-dependent protease
MRRDPALIGLAGPVSNLLLAIICAIVLRIIVMVLGAAPDVPALALTFLIVKYLIMINLVLALFNLIPIPPLDGSHLLHSILPPEGQRVIERIGPFGIIIAIFVASQFLSGPVHFLDDLIMRFVFWGQA